MPYSCTVAVEIHPRPPPPLESVSTSSLPRLAPPNLVVSQPAKGGDNLPPLPPPRGRGLRTGNAWEMRYRDLQLEQPLGCGKFGTVVRGTLRKDDDTLRCSHAVARLEMGQGGSDHQWRVAVKLMAGGSTLEEGGCQCMCGHPCWTSHSSVVVAATSSGCCGELRCIVLTSCTTHSLVPSSLPPRLPDW